jgi:hypothetical protein
MLLEALRKVRVWHWKLKYRQGRVVTQFLVPDIRRDVEVVDTSEIGSGFIGARVRTWNVMYAIHEVAPEPPFGDVGQVAIRDLWKWTGENWGGPVPDPSGDAP